MSYDLNILCVNQKNALGLPFTTSIELRSELEFPDSSRYHSIWPFMSNTKGIWYSLGKDEDGWFHAMSIIDADFDKEIERNLAPFWILDDDVLSNLKPMILCDEHRRDFERIIRFLIQNSSCKTVMLMARFQGGETEIIEGVLRYEEFIRLLRQSKILFNVCYIISD